MSKPALWTKDFVLITIANMFYIIGFYMMIPLIPIYVIFRGGTEPQVGMIAASFTVAAIIMRFLVPSFLTKVTKTNLLRIGLFLSMAVTASCWLTVSIPSILIVRVLQGLGFGVVSTICTALAADLLPDERRGEGIGYFGMGTTLMIAIAPAIGLYFIDNFDGATGFGLAFLIASVGQLFAIILLSRFKPDPRLINIIPKTKTKERFIDRVFDKALTIQVSMLLLFGIARSAEQNYLPLLALEFDIKNLSLYYIVQTIVSFVIKYFSGILYDRKGHKWAIIPGGLSVIAALYTLSISTTIGMLIIAAFFSGFSMGCLMPAMQVWTMNSVAPHRRSVASASYFNFYDIGQSTGAIIVAYLIVHFGFKTSYRITIIPMILFMAIYLVALKVKNVDNSKNSKASS